MNGNQAYAAAYDGVEFIAHVSVIEDLRSLHAAQRVTELEELPASIELRRRWLHDGRTGNGTLLTATDSAAVLRSIALREAYNAELHHIAPTPPTRTVTNRLELDIGGQSVVLMHAGPAHTRGDLIVVLPEHGIVAAGDLVEAGMPYFGDSYPAGWLHALDRIAALQPVLLLPAHGPVQRDGVLLEDTRALLAEVLEDGGEGEVRWAERYRVAPTAFRAAVTVARERARLERGSR